MDERDISINGTEIFGDAIFEKVKIYVKPSLTRTQLCSRFVFDFFVAVFVGSILFLPAYPFIHNTDYELSAAAFFTQLGMLLIGANRLIRLRKINQPILPMFKGPWIPALLWGTVVGIALFALNVAHGIILDSFLPGDLDENNVWLQLEDMSLWAGAVTILAGGIMAPIVEEFYMRGVLFGTLTAGGYAKTGVIFSTILFVILHLDPLNSIAYAILGLGFIGVYLKTRNLASAILAHAINNLLGFFFILIPF